MPNESTHVNFADVCKISFSEYVEKLTENVLSLAETTTLSSEKNADMVPASPPPLCSNRIRPDKMQAVHAHLSRFLPVKSQCSSRPLMGMSCGSN